MRISGWLYLTEQSLCSACLLLLTGAAVGLKPRRPLVLTLLSLALGGMTAAAQWLHPLLRLTMLVPAAVSPAAVWPDAPARTHRRMGFLALLLSLMLSGVMRLLSALNLPGILPVLLGCLGLFVSLRISQNSTGTPACVSVELRLGMRRLPLTALTDTGNLLRDGLTGLPVIVVSRRTAAKLTGGIPADLAAKALSSRTACPEEALLPGMRLMPIRTISGTSLMTIFRPDSVRIRDGGAWQEVSALIGISPDGYEGFQALVPACLVAGAWAPLKPNAISQGG